MQIGYIENKIWQEVLSYHKVHKLKLIQFIDNNN